MRASKSEALALHREDHRRDAVCRDARHPSVLRRANPRGGLTLVTIGEWLRCALPRERVAVCLCPHPKVF